MSPIHLQQKSREQVWCSCQAVDARVLRRTASSYGVHVNADAPRWHQLQAHSCYKDRRTSPAAGVCIANWSRTAGGQCTLSLTRSHKPSSCCFVAGASGRPEALCAYSTTGLSLAASSGLNRLQGSGVGAGSASGAAMLAPLACCAAAPVCFAAGALAAAATPADWGLPVALVSVGGASAGGGGSLNSCTHSR